MNAGRTILRSIFGGRKTHLWMGASLLLVMVGMVFAGLWVRDWAFDFSRPIRFEGDVDNGYNWGKRALEQGYLNVFDLTGGDELDYGPFRLGVMTAWVKWLSLSHPQLGDRQPDRAFHAFVLYFNSAMELLAANGALVLVRWWRRQQIDPAKLRWWTGAWVGVAAFALYWFNPAILLDAHCWPQWDTWLCTGLIWAVYFGCRRWWMTAGVALAITGLFKGQIVFCLPVFAIWALAMWDWRGLLRLIAGLLAGTGFIGCFWEVSRLVDIDGVPTRQMVWPSIIWMVVFVTCFIFLARHMRLRWHWSLAMVGIGLLSCIPMFGLSARWLECSYLVGKDHYLALTNGENSTLAALLACRFGFPNDNVHQIVYTLLPGTLGHWQSDPIEITIRQTLVSLFLLFSALCAVMAARHFRRRDVRFLVAITTPWLLFFAVMPQMHERYLVFFAGASCLLAAVSLELTLLGIFLSWIAFLNIARDMVPDIDSAQAAASWQFWIFAKLRLLIVGSMPEIAWAVLLVLVIFLWKTCRRTPRWNVGSVAPKVQSEGATAKLATSPSQQTPSRNSDFPPVVDESLGSAAAPAM